MTKTGVKLLLKKVLKTSSLSLAFVSVLVLLGCPGTPPRPAETNTAPAEPAVAKSDFDAERAMGYVRKQVEFGPRPAGSAELEKTRAWMIDQLRSFGLTVTTQDFQATTPEGQKKFANVIAELPGTSSDVIVIGSHYDTKLFKDFTFVGAVDGASSTGTVMEMARVLAGKKIKLNLTYRFVFFDGEEAFCTDWDECKNPNPADSSKPLADNTYGSRHYVAQLIEKNELSRTKAMILLDMIGYKELRLGRCDLSSAWLLDVIWQTAKQLDYKEFVNVTEGVGDDDHSPFLKAGVDAVDIIQLSTYPYWHTKDDTLDKVSAKSLKVVGDTVIASLPKIEERLATRR